MKSSIFVHTKRRLRLPSLFLSLFLVLAILFSGDSGRAASLLAANDPDLCALLPVTPGLLLDPGIGGRNSTLDCKVANKKDNRLFDSMSIHKEGTPQDARNYLHSTMLANQTSQTPWVLTSAYGDAGFGYDQPAKTIGDPGAIDTLYTPNRIWFAEGCYVVSGSAGFKPDDAERALPAGPLQELARAVDRQLQNAPCGTVADTDAWPLITVSAGGKAQCPAFDSVGAWVSIIRVPDGVPSDHIAIFNQTGSDTSRRGTSYVQLNQAFNLYGGETIHLPAVQSASSAWQMQIAILGTSIKYYGWSGTTFALDCGTHVAPQPSLPLHLVKGIAYVILETSDLARNWPSILDVAVTNIIFKGVTDSGPFSYHSISPGDAVLNERLLAPGDTGASFMVDATSPSAVRVVDYAGNVGLFRQSNPQAAVTLHTGQATLASQSAINPPGPALTSDVPGAGSRFFAETSHEVSGIFLDYWASRGALAQQGFPISPRVQETSDLNGKIYTVQYFERAVFEFHPEYAPPNDVLLSQLGTFRYKQKYPNGAPNQHQDQANGHLFTETGHWVGGTFYKYWQEHGGLAQQGLPLSDEFTEVSQTDGKSYTVQYFERAVFEMHPENKPPNDVLLSLLGVFYDQQKHGSGGGGGGPTSTPTPAASSVACGHQVSPEIFAKWQQLGAETGVLGCPDADEIAAGPSPKGTTGRSINFSKGDGGTIVLHKSGLRTGKAFEVNGCLWKLYSSLGATRSWLGFPVSDEYSITGGRRGNFEGGYISWDAQTGVCTSTAVP